MKEKPILMCGDMVRPTLADLKNQTRRIVNPKLWPLVEASEKTNGHVALHMFDYDLVSPYGEPGDRLWVRETHARLHEGLLQHLDPDPDSCHWSTAYRAEFADGGAEFIKPYGVKWNPSIFMKREYSRITLEVTKIRVERVQAISSDDAIAEGIERKIYDEACGRNGWKDVFHYPFYNLRHLNQWTKNPVWSYESLWDLLNGKPKPILKKKKVAHYVSFPFKGEARKEQYRGLDHFIYPNPYVWVIEFKRITEAAR